MRTGAAALEIKGVTVSFGGLVALNEVDIVVPTGGVVAVIGPNGSGKSTLFNVDHRAGAGRWRHASASTARRSSACRRIRSWTKGIARTFQNIRLFPNLTVLENVLIGQHARLHTGALAARVCGRPAPAREEKRGARAGRWRSSPIFGNRLVPRVDQIVSGLSYANRRRVEIARALASRPRLLLLDEPTAGMNPAETLELADQIKSLQRARADRPADRAQARCRHHAGRHGLSCSTMAR